MKIVLKFERSGWVNSYFFRTKTGLSLCAKSLYDLFHLPAGVQKLTLTMKDMPMAGPVYECYWKDTWDGFQVKGSDGRWITYTTTCGQDNWIQESNLAGKHFWFYVEYEQ